MAIPAYCLDSVGGLPSVVVADGAAGDSADPNEESF